MDDLKPQLRGQIARYLSGAIDVRSLHDWLVQETWEVEHRAPREVADMARGAQLLLEEFAAESWSEAELRGRLCGLVGVVGTPELIEVAYGSLSSTSTRPIPITLKRPGFTVEWTHAGKRPETASA